MYKAVYQLKSLGQFETLNEAFKIIYDAIKKEKTLSWQMLEATIWIEAPYDIISFYDARDEMCKQGYLVNGEWVNKNESEPASPKGISAEDHYGKDVKPEPKPLAQYLAEYLATGINRTHKAGMPMDFTKDGLKSIFEQALDTYKDTESDKVKPLAQYLDEYIEHEVELNNICAATALLYAYSSWRELLEQALDAYESTENVRIKIEKC